MSGKPLVHCSVCGAVKGDRPIYGKCRPCGLAVARANYARRNPNAPGRGYHGRRTCSQCAIALTPENKVDGMCRDCQSAKAKQWALDAYYRHRDKRAPAAAAASRARHEKLRDDPAFKAETIRRQRVWKLANPDVAKASKQVSGSKRRAAERKGDLTKEQWLEILVSFNRACAYCLRDDEPMQLEHVIALASGGAHTADNVVPACKSCNSRKRARGPLAMLNIKAA